jgi:arginyl-tRNA synthetase
LIDWAGRDAVRFFLSSRKADTEFVFDVNLAQEQSESNPVFYVQYAHARICAVIEQAKQRGIILDEAEVESANWQLLVEPEALTLLKWINQYPTTLSFACEQLSPHLIAFFVRDLAQKLHSFYNAHRVLVDDKALCLARLALLLSVRQVIANGLSLLGVCAPNKM